MKKVLETCGYFEKKKQKVHFSPCTFEDIALTSLWFRKIQLWSSFINHKTKFKFQIHI